MTLTANSNGSEIDRPSGRNESQIRPTSIEIHVTKHADGSCLIKCGDTHVLCTASIDEQVPRFIKGSGAGWVTAEYGMLPGATGTRTRREATQGKQGGRTVEIQRLIGRSLRAAVDFKMLGERQIIIDCDVLQADGGTRCASITGGYVALHLACQKLVDKGMIKELPVTRQIAAVSCGIYGDVAIADLDYAEDSNAEVDANFVISSGGHIIEIQGTAEKAPFTRDQLNHMLDHAFDACRQLHELQAQVLSNG